AAAGLYRSAGHALRLLLQRHDHQGGRAPLANAQADGGADPRPYERAHLPLRHLSADHEVDPAGIGQDGGRRAMNAHTDLPFARRAPPKGGGALIVGLSIGGAPVAMAARGDVAAPPDANAIDSWIAIHADNTATIYFGKIEMGQGNTTGLLQIAGE